MDVKVLAEFNICFLTNGKQATSQVYCFGSLINLFCQTRNKRQKVLHWKWNHQYVGVPYRRNICRARRDNFSTNHKHTNGNKLCPSPCHTFPWLLWGRVYSKNYQRQNFPPDFNFAYQFSTNSNIPTIPVYGV